MLWWPPSPDSRKCSKFTTVTNWDVNIWFAGYLICDSKGALSSQLENHCSKSVSMGGLFIQQCTTVSPQTGNTTFEKQQQQHFPNSLLGRHPEIPIPPWVPTARVTPSAPVSPTQFCTVFHFPSWPPCPLPFFLPQASAVRTQVLFQYPSPESMWDTTFPTLPQGACSDGFWHNCWILFCFVFLK